MSLTEGGGHYNENGDSDVSREWREGGTSYHPLPDVATPCLCCATCIHACTCMCTLTHCTCLTTKEVVASWGEWEARESSLMLCVGWQVYRPNRDCSGRSPNGRIGPRVSGGRRVRAGTQIGAQSRAGTEESRLGRDIDFNFVPFPFLFLSINQP